MIVFPAIDLRGGRCVRLLQGRADAETVYADDPGAVAHGFFETGATWIHVVDLDGAFGGVPANSDAVRAIVGTGAKVQLGGGLRDEATVARALSSGVSRVVIGTRAAESADFVARLVSLHGDSIAVGIDARDGMVAVKGWVETTNLPAVGFAQRMESAGAGTIIYTDIATDGMMTGPNFPALEMLLGSVKCSVIASGGVASIEHVRRLAALARTQTNLAGVITGKAIYEGTLDLAEALAAARA